MKKLLTLLVLVLTMCSTVQAQSSDLPAPNEIWYTSIGNKKVDPYNPYTGFDDRMSSNEYNAEKGMWCIKSENAIENIRNQAFWECDKLETIILPEGVKTIVGRSFDRCSSLTSITIPSTVTTLGERIFYYCTNLTSVTIPAGVTTLGDEIFAGCSSLTSVTIPAGVTTLGSMIFYGCSSLTSVTIPAGVTTLGERCFTGCWSLTSVTIPSSVTSIEQGAFMECKSLKSITLPGELTRIGEDAFYGCENLQTAYFLGDVPTDVNKDNLPFANSGSNVGGTILLVPSEYVENYKTAGFENVVDVNSLENVKDIVMTNIEKVKNNLSLPEDRIAEIQTYQTNIQNADNIDVVFSELEKVWDTIDANNVKELKATAIAEIDNKMSEISAEARATLQTTVEESKECINNASIREVINRELDLIKDKIEAIVTYYVYQDYLSEEDKEESIYLILSKKSGSLVLKALVEVYKKETKSYLTSCWINFPQDLINNYKTKIDNAYSVQNIDLIITEAQQNLDQEPHLLIGDIRCYLRKGSAVHELYYYYYPKFTLTDGVRYQAPADALQLSPEESWEWFTYTRTLPVGIWQCWYEPFFTNVDSEKFDAAEVAGVLIGNNNEMVVAFRKLKNGVRMYQNKIYVIRAKEGHSVLTFSEPLLWKQEETTLKFSSAYDDYELGGYYGNDPLPFAENGKSWYTLNSKGQFALRKSTDELKPQRFWLTVTQRRDSYYVGGDIYAQAKAIIGLTVIGDDEDDTTTGLNQTTEDGIPTSSIYDMQGRRVTNIQSGQVYIMNGKKYVAR